MEEIIEHIYYEIKNSGYEKKLLGGIVLTGGGAQLKHIAQLTEFITGFDTRIGYPNEYLSNEIPPEMASPMYATGIGLVEIGIERYSKEQDKLKDIEEEPEEQKTEPGKQKKVKEKKVKDPSRVRRSFPELFLDKIKGLFEEDIE
jgi:cell division protein FtsA